MVKWLSCMPGITSQLVTQTAEWHMTVELPGDLHNPAPRHTLAAWSWVAAQRRNLARHQGLTLSVCCALQREATDFRSSEHHRDTAGTPTHLHATITGFLLHFAHTPPQVLSVDCFQSILSQYLGLGMPICDVTSHLYGSNITGARF